MHFRNIFASLDETGDLFQSTMYDIMMAPIKHYQIVTHGYYISEEELNTFVNNLNTPDSAYGIKSNFSAIRYMINPAFYNVTNGFLGTYDESASIFYAFTNNTLSESSDTTAIDHLFSIDLNGITPYVPAEVVSAIITVE